MMYMYVLYRFLWFGEGRLGSFMDRLVHMRTVDLVKLRFELLTLGFHVT